MPHGKSEWEGGRKQRMGQDNETELLQVCAGAVIQAGDPLLRLQEKKTPSPARSHSLTLLERQYVFGILPAWHKSHLTTNNRSVLCLFKMWQGLGTKEL